MPRVKSARGGLNESLFHEVIGSLVQGNQKGVANIIDFARSPWGLNFPLTPVQRFMLKCFYGLPLNEKEPDIIVPDTLNSKKLLGPMTEFEFAQWSYQEKRCNINFADKKNQGRHFFELQLVLGRRSGKSAICSVVIDYELYKLFSMGDPHAYYNVPPGQEIAVIGTGPTDEQAGLVFNMAQTFAQNSQVMRDRLTHETQTYFQIQTDADIKMYGRGRSKKGSLQFITGSSSSSSIRGHNAIIVLFDEMAFFLENAGKFSIEEVYGALTPSISKFSSPSEVNPITNKPRMDGKILCLSSPYAHYGKFYSLYRDSFSEESQRQGQRLVFRYYTALVNPGNAPEDYLREQRRQDRTKFHREFEAEFDERITSWIDSEPIFRNNVRRPYSEVQGKPGVRYFWGFDLGVTNDGTAISIVHRENDKYFHDFSEVFYSGSSPVWEALLSRIYCDHATCARWKRHTMLPLFEIAQYVKTLSQRFPIYRGFVDQFSGHAFFQILNQIGISGISLSSVNEVMKSQMYQLIKDLVNESFLDIMDHPVLVPEILSLEAELRPQNRIAVNKRTSTDGSFQDDITDSFVRAVWDCWRFYNVESGINGKNQLPAMFSFGVGRSFMTEGETINSAQKINNAKSLVEYQRLKRQMHGITTTRHSVKRSRPFGGVK